MVFVWTVSDIVGLVIFCLMAFTALPVLLDMAWKAITCKHIKYHENRACHGVCCECGKDLGFIGTLRETKPEGEV